LWGGFCLLAALVTYLFVHETQGLTLEKVDKMLEESTPRASKKWVPHSTFASEMNPAESVDGGSAEKVVVGETVEHTV
jgi:hypothetical protein